MKKRMVSIIVVMILLVSMLSGCGLITLNAERDGAQVVSTVDVEGMQGVVTKVDLVGFFNQLGYLYIQYYGWTPEKIINEFVTQLSNKEILVLYAIQDMAKIDGKDLNEIKNANNAYVANMQLQGTKKYDAKVRPYDLFNFFRPDEQFFVIKQTKKSLNDSFEKLVEEVEAEYAANAPEEEEEEKPEEDKDEEEEEALKPRTKKTLTAKTTYEEDPSITAETVASEKTFFEEMDAKVKDKKFTKAEVEAYNRLKKDVEKGYDSVEIAWNVLLDNQKESRLLEKYREEYINKDVAVTEEEILSRYNFTVSNDLNTVFDKDSYKTAAEADKENNLLVHNNETGYFTIKSILLQFSDDQKKALEAIKGGILCDTDDKDAIANYRDQLARDKAFGIKGIGEAIGGIKVNVSNPDYDENAVCKDENCECKACTNNKDYKKNAKCDNKDCKCVACVNSAYTEYDVDYDDVINRLSVDLKKAQDELVFAEGLELTDAEKSAARVNAKMDMFDDYIYLVNDDPGMFNSTGYITNTAGESQFVAEYVLLARELAKLVNDENPVGLVGGVTDGMYENPIDKNAADIHIYSAVVDGEPINYIVNDFGIHIVMVTYVARENGATTSFEKDGLYRLNLDYVTKYENVYKTDDDGKVILDENGNKTLKELKNVTVKDRISEAILNEKKSENYTKKEKDITDGLKDKISKNEKLIKSVIKDIEKALGDQGGHAGHDHTHNN